MALVFPTVSGLVIVLVLAAYHSTRPLGWLAAAAVTFTAFAIFCGSSERSPAGRSRVAAGALIGIGSLAISFIALTDSTPADGQYLAEWTALAMLIALFLVRGRRRREARSSEPAGGAA